MTKEAKFKTLRAFVDSYPRTIRQGQIAALLGLSQGLLSAYLKGRRPSRDVALRLARDHSIDLEGLLDPGRFQQQRRAS